MEDSDDEKSDEHQHSIGMFTRRRKEQLRSKRIEFIEISDDDDSDPKSKDLAPPPSKRANTGQQATEETATENEQVIDMREYEERTREYEALKEQCRLMESRLARFS